MSSEPRRVIDSYVEETGVKLLTADGFDDAILGVCRQFNREFVVYDTARVLQILHDRDGMTHEEAVEFFEFNIVGAWVGKATPGFVTVLKAPPKA